METFSALLALCAGKSPVNGEFPAQRPVTRVLIFPLICAWINVWENSYEAGDLRRHRAHYDVIVMTSDRKVWILLHIHAIISVNLRNRKFNASVTCVATICYLLVHLPACLWLGSKDPISTETAFPASWFGRKVLALWYSSNNVKHRCLSQVNSLLNTQSILIVTSFDTTNPLL